MRCLFLFIVPAIVVGELSFIPPVAADAEDVPAKPAVVRNQVVKPIAKAGKGKKAKAADAAPQLSDEEALKKANLDPKDGNKLLEYLRQRTLSDADQGKINGIIARFGADSFEDRVKATDEVALFGPAAIGPLKKAEKDDDAEIAFRAQVALSRVEKVPHAAAAAAAVRAIVELKPKGAAGVLIGFLPLADSEVLAEVIRESLIALAVRDGKADEELVAALTGNSPIRRSAAYVALIEGGAETERIRIPDAYPKVREAVLKEVDPEAKFAGLWSLAMTTREKEYIPALIELIPKLGRGRIWQLEELLLLMAGNHPKDGRFLKSPESLAKAREAWLGWWKTKGDAIDFVKFDYAPRIEGITDIIEMDYRGYGQGRVISLGPDLKEKWRITGVNNPTDVKVTPEGRIWVVESNNNQVTERDTQGTIITRRNAFQQPINIDLLPDGGMVIICRNNVLEWDKTGKQVWAHARQNYDIMAGRRLPNGETLFLTNQFRNPNAPQANNAFRLDAKGTATGKDLSFGYIYQLQTMDVVGEDKVLVCERDMNTPGQQTDRVAEYDLKTGKQTWKHDCPPNSAPTSCQRLPNGNTLICLMNSNQLIEVDPSGEIVWEYQAKDGLKVGRAYRR